MKTVKNLLAIVLTLALVFSFAGCHAKGEIAITFGDIEFTSAMYSMALLNADSEARTLVDEQLAAAGQEGGETAVTSEVDYLAQTVEGVSFKEWVEKTAIEELSLMASYKKLCKENGIELEADVISSIDSNVDYYYSYYEAMLSANGIGKETYREMQLCYAYGDAYFEFLYGEGGSKEVKTEDLKAAYDESYRTAFLLYTDLSQFSTEEEKAAEKEKLNGYKQRLDNGESIVDIYNEYNELTDENKATKEADVISVLADGEVDANYAFEDFATVKALKDGETVIIDETEHDHENATSYYFVVKAINTDGVIVNEEDKTTYFDNLKDTIRWNLKQEEYETDMAEYAKTLTYKINKHAIKPFKVEKITYPSAQ